MNGYLQLDDRKVSAAGRCLQDICVSIFGRAASFFGRGIWPSLGGFRSRARIYQRQKLSPGAGKALLSAMDNGGGPRVRARAAELKSAAFGLLRSDGALRQDTDPRSQCDCFFDRLNVVELHHDCYRDVIFPEEALQFAPDNHFLVERDESCPFRSGGSSIGRLAKGWRGKPRRSSFLHARE